MPVHTGVFGVTMPRVCAKLTASSTVICTVYTEGPKKRWEYVQYEEIPEHLDRQSYSESQPQVCPLPRLVTLITFA